ncbi:MAG TPA: NUDIX domain-containing protein [Saprospiraceae bacterium]|nr:NUDIX domain-containing protein [Saprospiraceae bacterium]
MPNLSIDLVIIGYKDNAIKCLLLKMGEKWLLPGGYIQKDESVDEAALNILKARTGLEDTYLKFLAVFGDKNRQFDAVASMLFKASDMDWKADNWLSNRFVSLAYYSLVNIENTHPKVSHIDEAFDWFDFEALPDMWMDHRSIVLSAREQLKASIQHEHNTYNLLPEVFTMPELYELHQTILSEKIDRSRFQKKMLATGLFERLPKLQKSTPGRNPYQYRVKKHL